MTNLGRFPKNLQFYQHFWRVALSFTAFLQQIRRQNYWPKSTRKYAFFLLANHRISTRIEKKPTNWLEFLRANFTTTAFLQRKWTQNYTGTSTIVTLRRKNLFLSRPRSEKHDKHEENEHKSAGPHWACQAWPEKPDRGSNLSLDKAKQSYFNTKCDQFS